jgi:hypothetical protein
MKRSSAPSVLYSKLCPEPPSEKKRKKEEGEKVNHLDRFRIPDGSEKEEDSEEKAKGLLEQLEKQSVGNENLPPAENRTLNPDDEYAYYYICFFTELDDKKRRSGDGLLEVKYSTCILYDMNSKQLVKIQIVRTPYTEGDRIGQQRVAIKTQKKKELFLCEGQ